METMEVAKGPQKRKLGHNKRGKGKKKLKMVQAGSGERVKIDNKMKKLLRKKARDYNSDDDESAPAIGDKSEVLHDREGVFDSKSSDEEDEDHQMFDQDDEDNEPEITKFQEGFNAFRMAFKKIMKTTSHDDVLGPVLSADKKLIAEKLAEETEERKVKAETKKEKHSVGEKGHVKPANYLDSHEKFLIGVATKGVVKLFNAVNKAQSAQKGLNPLRSKDAKALKKRRKEAFFSELKKKPSQSADTSDKAASEGPAWAPLRDNYMLTNSKLKNWNKMPDDSSVPDDFGMPGETSSDED